MHISVSSMLYRLAVALVCGGLLGYEREWREHAAGLRTHTLVAVGACLIMITSAYGLADVLSFNNVAFDPSRIAAQIVSGIGFLGAGVIIFRKDRVTGLTTAASVWVSAGVGMAAGGGLFLLAVIATAAILLVQTVIRSFEVRHFSRYQEAVITFLMSHDPENLAAVQRVVAGSASAASSVEVEYGKGDRPDRVRVFLSKLAVKERDELMKRVSELDGVLSVRCRLR